MRVNNVVYYRKRLPFSISLCNFEISQLYSCPISKMHVFLFLFATIKTLFLSSFVALIHDKEGLKPFFVRERWEWVDFRSVVLWLGKSLVYYG